MKITILILIIMMTGCRVPNETTIKTYKKAQLYKVWEFDNTKVIGFSNVSGGLIRMAITDKDLQTSFMATYGLEREAPNVFNIMPMEIADYYYSFEFTSDTTAIFKQIYGGYELEYTLDKIL